MWGAYFPFILRTARPDSVVRNVLIVFCIILSLQLSPPSPPFPSCSHGHETKHGPTNPDSPDPREVTPPAAGGGGARDGGGKPILYDALLRLSLVAKGSHGLMDASPLKRAMDRHS